MFVFLYEGKKDFFFWSIHSKLEQIRTEGDLFVFSPPGTIGKNKENLWGKVSSLYLVSQGVSQGSLIWPTLLQITIAKSQKIIKSMLCEMSYSAILDWIRENRKFYFTYHVSVTRVGSSLACCLLFNTLSISYNESFCEFRFIWLSVCSAILHFFENRLNSFP